MSKLLLLPLLLVLLAPATAGAAYRAKCVPGDASSPPLTACAGWGFGRC